MEKIDNYINSLPEWQQSHLRLFRKLIHEADPNIKEEWKWNVPVFVLDSKMIFAMSGFKAHTKYNFITNGALLDDKHKLFNNGFESKKSRGIDLKESAIIDEKNLKALIIQSVEQIKG
ncbi:MAG: DUF1801 domain-containing protein [Candidatus Saccharimonadales bacterium]